VAARRDPRRGDPPPPEAPPARGRLDLAERVAIAIPAALFAIFIIWQGGEVWALGLLLLGVIAMGELYMLMGRVRPAALAGFLTLAALIAAALYGEPRHVLIVLVAAFPLTFFLALLRPRREHVSWAIATTLFGVLWVGLAMVHAVWLRELAIVEGGDEIVTGMGLVFDVVIATFVGDSCAYFVGRAYGRTKIAPLISPNKTLEGLAGGIVGGTFTFWLCGLYQDWLTGWDALLIGFLVALAAPMGDLFESLVKRDLEVKDTGRAFGAHGGALDRLDAVIFTIVVGYYAAVGLGYG
jgi:phosphatidate cytidylyltransferase